MKKLLRGLVYKFHEEIISASNSLNQKYQDELMRYFNKSCKKIEETTENFLNNKEQQQPTSKINSDLEDYIKLLIQMNKVMEL